MSNSPLPAAPSPAPSPRASRRGGAWLLITLALIVWGLWAGISAALESAYEDLSPPSPTPIRLESTPE